VSADPIINYIDVDAAIEFLTLVTQVDVHMNVVAIHPKTERITAFACTRETIADTAVFIKQHAEWNLYWSPNPLKKALDKKAGKGDVAAMRWAHLDRDDPSEAALAVIRAMMPAPTMILFSGGGWQAFWLLRKPIPLTWVDKEHPGNVPELEETNCGVLRAAGEPDEGTRNIDRIMRLPGTINWPTAPKLKKNPQRQPALARLIEHDMGRVYALAELPKATPDAKPDADKKVDRSRVLFNGILKDVLAGATDEQVHSDYANDPHVLSQAPGRRKGTIDRCIAKARAILAQTNEDVAEMNAKHALVWIGNKLSVMWLDQWNGPLPRLASVADMRIHYQNRRSAPFDAWIRSESRAEYTGIVFEPGGLVTPGAFNLWHGFAVEPLAGQCDLFLNMVRDVICSGDEALYQYVIAWCADLVQNPADRTGICLVLRGKPGTGKGTFAHALGSLLGEHFVYVSRSEHVVGKFNAHLATALLLFADEAVFAGDRSTEGVLKSLITESYLPIEAKFRDVVRIRNHVRIIMASNQNWVVSAALDDRRFAIIDVGDQHHNDTAYFGPIHKELDAGGRQALLHFLQSYPLGGIDLRVIPKTDARLDQQFRSLDSEQRWWLDALQTEDHSAPPGAKSGWKFGDAVTPATLHVSYLHHCDQMHQNHRLSLVQFGIKMIREFLPGLGKREARADERQRLGIDARERVYVMPSLDEARRRFEKIVGRPISWPDGAGGGDEM
jgi:hypothetical protein